ncbi:aminopeptidase N isoform X3 [Nilaparvata lugens]|uniref:aminopeptidase N isoform X3 n=1 Tax=Nilaparvata lugens TaxID=108931 RepID=UPI00193E4728|nr:aminopeptidase N isoform X3 [Nilaparvata lugens]
MWVKNSRSVIIVPKMGYFMTSLIVSLLPYTMNLADSKMLTGSPIAFQRSTHFNNQRLPLTIFPIHYRLNLSVPLIDNNFTVTGDEWVFLNCTVTTREVVFNVKNIDIDKAKTRLYDSFGGSFVRIIEQRYESSREMFVIRTATPLISRRQYELGLQFSYVLNDELMGFYRSSYIDHATGEKHWIATTQFSPTAARRAFPCWDEPSFKAYFSISIAHHNKYHTLSNMPISNSIPAPGMNNDWIQDVFKTTLPMSTYLVAFIVSDFVPYKTVIDNSSGWKFTLWSRKDILSQTEYAAEMGPKLLSFLEEYFSIKFPLPKQDVVAIPDFGFSAMENWGLITFRETSLLYKPGKTSEKSKLDIAFVFGHELAHQWFGNLVTPAWWNDLWLKEGFATFIGYTAINHMEPSWKVLDQFLLQQVLGSMKIDSLNATHEIEVEVEEPKDIVQIFDNISYMKGASIINMMSQFLGERVFRAGLKRYLTEHAYSNACQDQLWRAVTVEAASSLPQGVDVKQIMDTWTLLPGFPVVTVHRDYEQGTASVTQERYFVLNEFTSEDKWWVPVSYTTQSEMDFNNTQPKIWLEPSKPTKKITNIDPDDWLLINLKHTGYYKVNYDEENWRRLQESYLKMPETIRAQLLSDVFSLAATGRTNYSTALGFSLHLPRDNSYFPWSIASEKLSFIGKLMRDTDASDDLKKYMLHLVVNTNKELTFFPKTPITGYLNLLLQLNLVGVAADSDHQKLVHEAKQFLNDEILGKNVSIMADFKTKAYCTAIKHGGYEEWNFLWKKYHETNIASDRVVILMALGCSKNSTILSRYLNRILDPDSEIRKQDGAFLFEVVANKNPVLAFDFLKKRWENLQSYFGLGFRQMAKIIESLGTHLNMEQQLIELEKLRSDHMQSLGSTSNSFKQTIERVKFNIQWMNNHYESVTTWLKEMLPKLKKT